MRALVHTHGRLFAIGLLPLLALVLAGAGGAGQYMMAVIAAGVIFVIFVVIVVWWFVLRNRLGKGAGRPLSRRDRATSRMTALEVAVDELRNHSEELHEDKMWTEWLETMPDPEADETPVEDRLRFVQTLRPRLYDIQQESEGHRNAVARMSEERQQAGYRADSLREAAYVAPASAMSWIRNVVEEMEGQRRENRGNLGDLLGEIEEARRLCNRQITNAVARRLPLGILGVADDMLKRANTAEEVKARREVVEGILDNIYDQYFPGARRRQR